MAEPSLRHERAYVPLTKDEFRERFYARFYDPVFEGVSKELERIFELSWDGYIKYRKSPRTRAAGPGFADPDFELPLEWLHTRSKIHAAEAQQKDASSPSRVLVIAASSRSEHTCPGEISKSRRLARCAQEAIQALAGYEVDFLDVSALADEPWKVIHPCKACVSTAMPLCHWPCSCYPNHAMGQTNDWMNELYPRWAAAHGVFIATPVNWYHTPGSFKVMMDRLVCADGGNPDPTTTHGKDPLRAKKLELDGWHYPKHLAGRAFAVITHGDTTGAENLRRNLSDWLTDMGLIQAGPYAAVDLLIGYYKPYATSHDDLDADPDVFATVRNAALSLANMVRQIRTGQYHAPHEGLHAPREK